VLFLLVIVLFLFFFELRLITTLVYFGHWSVLLRFKADYHISIFTLLVIVLSVLLRFKADYHISIFSLLVIVLSVLLRFKADYHISIFTLFCCIVCVAQSLVYCVSCVFGPLFFLLSFFHFAIELSVLRFTVSDVVWV
jgi:hypothetical protein